VRDRLLHGVIRFQVVALVAIVYLVVRKASGVRSCRRSWSRRRPSSLCAGIW
jgi:hypothetical protein